MVFIHLLGTFLVFLVIEVLPAIAGFDRLSHYYLLISFLLISFWKVNNLWWAVLNLNFSLQPDDKYEFSEPARIQGLVKNYSQFVSFPIYTWQEKSRTVEVRTAFSSSTDHFPPIWLVLERLVELNFACDWFLMVPLLLFLLVECVHEKCSL